MAGYIGSAASVVSSGAENKKTFTITGATTSLTGLNYTVGKVHVFQNGVRLVDGTDYTATNGTTITLTVAAQSGDNVVVISQAAFQVADALLTSGGTMTGDLTVQGAFTSKGIDDNADAVALTIDSSENVLVGTTSTDQSIAGHGFKPDGFAYHTRDGGAMLRLNRLTSDGDLMQIQKDGTTVGSIGVNSGDQVYFAASDGMGIKVDTDNTSVEASNASGADNDNAVNLGSSGTRWKDLYLSGGVYLGGTGSANKLEDYEEGTWTPTIAGTNNTFTLYNNYGKYTKVGRKVTIQFFQQTNSPPTFSNNNAVFRITGIPFTCSGSGYTGSQGSMNAQSFHFNGSSNNQSVSGQVEPSVGNDGGLALSFTVTSSGGVRGQVINGAAASGYIIEATVTYFTTQ